MDERALIQDFAEALARCARLGFAGEKPVAVWAMTLVAGHGRLGCSGSQLLREHRRAVRDRFLGLARQYGGMQDPANSWSVITGSQAELQRMLDGARDADRAFCEFGPQDAAAIDAWFREHVGRRELADSGADPARRSASAAPAPQTGRRSDQWYVSTPDDRTVEAWASFRLPFEPKAEKLEYRERLKQAILGMPGRSTGVVEAVYVSPTLPRNCDVENVLFYNVGAGAFRQLSPSGLSFEYRAERPGAAPDGRAFDHYVRYAISDRKHAVSAVNRGHALAGISDVPIRRLCSGSKPWEIWQDIERELDRRECVGEQPEAPGCFGINLVLSSPAGEDLNLVGILKPLFDGVVSALHQAVSVDAGIVRFVAAQTGEHPDTVLRWLTRRGPARVSTVCPAELYRDSVRWHPDDSRLRAGGVFIGRGASPTRTISLTVYRAS